MILSRPGSRPGYNRSCLYLRLNKDSPTPSQDIRTSGAVVTQGCDYTTQPGPEVTNPVTIPTSTWTKLCNACTLTGGEADLTDCTKVSDCTSTWKSDCQACTVTGGVQEQPRCTAVPKCPNVVVQLANSTFPVGNADRYPKKLREKVFNGLKSLCPMGAPSAKRDSGK